MRALAFAVSFVLAFLLFAVQPMATKMVLPTLGGTPAVWNTAMVTFQILLLLGYAYAHLLNSRLQPRWQWRIHGLLIAASFLFLPLSVHLVSSDALLQSPIRHLAGAFLMQIGLPFFVLSATAPLLQSWVARSNHPLSQTPYVLYSASNLGSMMGLLGYVALVEPNLALPQQSMGWSALYVLGTIALMLAGRKLDPSAQPAVAQAEPVRPRTVMLWVWLAFLPSALSLGVTTYITTDIAAVPLLWVLPLSLYLLSFVDAFRSRPIIVPIALRAAPIMGMIGLLAYGAQAHRYSQVFVLQLVVFAMLAFCLHGWLARFKPAPKHLTAFYFSMSIGGAMGGILNALIAPLIFTDTIEFPLALLAASVTGFVLWQRRNDGPNNFDAHLIAFSKVLFTVMVNTLLFYYVFGVAMGDFAYDHVTYKGQDLFMSSTFAGCVALFMYRRYLHLFYAVSVLAFMLLVLNLSGANAQQVLFKQRNFFGTEKVYEMPGLQVRYMLHNTTVHGVQPTDPKFKLSPTSYYLALTEIFKQLPVLREQPMAAIGLGAGTVQCLAQKTQHFDFFEINPLVSGLAENDAMFRYLSECPGTHTIHLGDGRIELAAQPDAHYGGIILDAFSSDAIPTHLMTRQAIELYFSKVVPHGVVLMHTTNRHISLWPLIATQAKSLGLTAYGKYFPSNPDDTYVYSSFWVVLAKDPKDIAPLLAKEPNWRPLEPHPDARPWTDDYINILPYLRVLNGER